MCAEELVMFITTLAIALAQGKSNDEIGMLSTIYSQLGDTLATIATKREYIESCCEENKTYDMDPPFYF